MLPRFWGPEGGGGGGGEEAKVRMVLPMGKGWRYIVVRRAMDSSPILDIDANTGRAAMDNEAMERRDDDPWTTSRRLGRINMFLIMVALPENQ